jgi:hypothetical protein
MSVAAPSAWSHIQRRDVLIVGAVHFFIVVAGIAAGNNYIPPRVLLLPLFAIHGTIPRALADDIGAHRLADVGDRFLIAWDKDGIGRLLTMGMLGGDIQQLLGGVFDDVVRCLEALREPHATHATFRHIWPQPLRTEATSLPATVSTPTQAMRMAFWLHVLKVP